MFTRHTLFRQFAVLADTSFNYIVSTYNVLILFVSLMIFAHVFLSLFNIYWAPVWREYMTVILLDTTDIRLSAWAQRARPIRDTDVHTNPFNAMWLGYSRTKWKFQRRADTSWEVFVSLTTYGHGWNVRKQQSSKSRYPVTFQREKGGKRIFS